MLFAIDKEKGRADMSNQDTRRDALRGAFSPLADAGRALDQALQGTPDTADSIKAEDRAEYQHALQLAAEATKALADVAEQFTRAAHRLAPFVLT